MLRMWTQEDLSQGDQRMTNGEKQGTDDDELLRMRRGGRRLKELREQKTLSGEQVVTLSGGEIRAPWLSLLENGKAGDPGIKKVAALAKVYGIDPNKIAELFELWA